MTVAVTRTASPIRLAVECPESASRIGRSWRPTSAKSNALTRKTSVSQTAVPCIRIAGVESCGARGSVEDERGGVVHEALALDDGHDAAWNAEPARDRGRRDRVGRRDDRPQHEGG